MCVIKSKDTPEICRFFGIIIALNYNDHPPPHFQVRYGEQKAIIAIDTLTLLQGPFIAKSIWIGDGVGRAPLPRRRFQP